MLVYCTYPVVSEPRMKETLVSCLPCPRVQHQQLSYKVFTIIRDMCEVCGVHCVVTGQGLGHGPVPVAPPEGGHPP